jgi:hypothetical protein
VATSAPRPTRSTAGRLCVRIRAARLEDVEDLVRRAVAALEAGDVLVAAQLGLEALARIEQLRSVGRRELRFAALAPGQNRTTRARQRAVGT